MGPFFRQGGDYAKFFRGRDILGKEVHVEDHREEVLKAERLGHGGFSLWLVCWGYVRRGKVMERGDGRVVSIMESFWRGKGGVRVVGGPGRV